MIRGIQKAIKDDPAIPAKSLREQFDKLLLQPLLNVDQGQVVSSMVIVIDALDECEREEDVEIILELLPRVEKGTDMVIRFFLTSRPESPIRFGFDQIDQSEYQNTILQNLDNDVIKRDITLYLRETFSRIRQKGQHDLLPGWPGEEIIEALAIMAVPLFIFVATVCRFVDNRKFNPEMRLQEFFKDSSGSKMDKTYQPILNQLLTEDESDTDKLVKEFQKIISGIILLAAPLSLSSLAELLEMPEGNISILLDSFHSVLTIPSDARLPIRILHLSFHDYLLDERTKAKQSTSRFWVDKREKHELITRQCLNPASTAGFLPPAFQSLNQVLPFLKEHFLHCLESMSILGAISEAVKAVDALLRLTKDTSNNAIFSLLSDAHRFILKFANIVDTEPLQLGPRVEENWSPELHTLEGHFDWVQSVAFSQDGQLLASGSYDRTIKLWDPATGTLKYTLEGHSGPVQSVTFSQDGQLLASGSSDQTIKLWDPATGTLKHTLEGHSGWVQSVAFSQDGQLLASGSSDQTIKLWDPATGTLKHTLGTDSNVTDIEFSKKTAPA
ncbi:hypothetical protein BDV12DRAFT_196507 [Aspergillus spectabilis]